MDHGKNHHKYTVKMTERAAFFTNELQTSLNRKHTKYENIKY